LSLRCEVEFEGEKNVSICEPIRRALAHPSLSEVR
jgi:hypothetical protein